MPVFCRECKEKVEDCPHFVPPLKVKRVEVYDPKVKSLAYDEPRRILEISFKNGQTWQLQRVPPGIYQELLHQTLSSFLKFIAHKYQANPVKTIAAEGLPASEPCAECNAPMTIRHQTGQSPPCRVLWECPSCKKTVWRSYGQDTGREKRARWH
jgi:hypothetical protein